MDPGALRELGAEAKQLGIRRPLVVTDPGVVACGLAEQIVAEARRAGLAPSLFAGVDPNPVEKNVREGLDAYRRENCDGVIGLGGGSPLDAAKGHPPGGDSSLSAGTIRRSIGWRGAESTPIVPPMIAIATTAGTGSEVGRSTVIILQATDRKTVIFSPHLMPNVALADPELTLGMPPKITAGTGLDALTHNVEAYLALGYHPLCDAIALQGARLAFQNLPRAVQNGKDLEARSNMLMAAMMGAVAFQKGLGAVHSLAHPLSSVANLHHGTTNGILLAARAGVQPPSIGGSPARSCRGHGGRGFPGVGHRSRHGAYRPPVRTLARGRHSINLGALGVTSDMIPLLARKAMEDACHQSNPRPCSEADMITLYEKAL